MTTKDIKIMLDAGHYGKINQSTVLPEYYESDFTWKFHNMLKSALERYGVEIGTTRADKNSDRNVTERGKLAVGYDALLSIHSNASSEPSKDRVSNYYQVPDGDHTKISKALAEALAVVMNETMECVGSYKISCRESEQDRDKDGVKDDYYGILRGAASVGCPAVILEHSYHTNKRATEWLMDEDNLKKLAENEARCIAEYFGIEKNTDSDKEVKMISVTLEQLSKGSKGEQVKNLQILLEGKDFNIGSSGADGIFGSKTEQAVIDFQTANGLAPDGICGKNTWDKILGV